MKIITAFLMVCLINIYVGCSQSQLQWRPSMTCATPRIHCMYHIVLPYILSCRNVIYDILSVKLDSASNRLSALVLERII